MLQIFVIGIFLYLKVSSLFRCVLLARGELIPESGLFVRINKEAAEDVQPSSLRMRSANLRRQEELDDEMMDPWAQDSQHYHRK